MKRFVIKVAVFTGLVLLISLLIHFVYLQNGENKSSNDYLSAIEDKHCRLQKIDSCHNRIIFAGGSNLAFGINSKSVQDSIGIPVVNLSLHAGLGLDFILNELYDVVRDGDIVVLSVEYNISKKGDYELQNFLYEQYPAIKQYIPNFYYSRLLRNVDVFQDELRYLVFGEEQHKQVDNVYYRGGFNDYGDVIAHLDKSAPVYLSGRVKVPDNSDELINAINKFADRLVGRDIKLFFAFPAYSQTEYNKNRVAVDSWISAFNRKLKVTILGNARDFILPDSMFFDTVYHLNKMGRENRTAKIINLLKHYIKISILQKK